MLSQNCYYWLEMNRRHFEGKAVGIHHVILSIKGFLCFWARAGKECCGVFFEHLEARWEETMFLDS